MGLFVLLTAGFFPGRDSVAPASRRWFHGRDAGAALSVAGNASAEPCCLGGEEFPGASVTGVGRPRAYNPQARPAAASVAGPGGVLMGTAATGVMMEVMYGG